MSNYSIALHGGAGTLVKGMMTPEKEAAYKNALQSALEIGYAILDKVGRRFRPLRKQWLLWKIPTCSMPVREVFLQQAEPMKWMPRS